MSYSKEDVIVTYVDEIWWAEIPNVITVPNQDKKVAINTALRFAPLAGQVTEGYRFALAAGDVDTSPPDLLQ